MLQLWHIQRFPASRLLSMRALRPQNQSCRRQKFLPWTNYSRGFEQQIKPVNYLLIGNHCTLHSEIQKHYPQDQAGKRVPACKNHAIKATRHLWKQSGLDPFCRLSAQILEQQALRQPQWCQKVLLHRRRERKEAVPGAMQVLSRKHWKWQRAAPLLKQHGAVLVHCARDAGVNQAVPYISLKQWACWKAEAEPLLHHQSEPGG